MNAAAHEWLRECARRLTGPASAKGDTALLARPQSELVALAWAIKDVCLEAWTAEPQRTERCAALLNELHTRTPEPEIGAAAAWCEGLAQLTRGEMVTAVACLDRAHQALLSMGQLQRAAQSQVAKVIALSMLGRHDDAAACGEQTRQALISSGDDLGAGKVELNLGSMHLLRDRYADAAACYRQAAVRFARAGDAVHSIMADIGVASALSWQFDFDEASRLYERAAMRTRARGLTALQAVIDTNRGRLDLHRGRFEPALRSFEAALHEAERDGMPQHVAEARRDMADAYLALNLLPEALALYDLTLQSCERLDAPTEQAWAHVQRALVLMRQGDARGAARGLETAHALFAAADNPVGSALTDLRSAALSLALGDAPAALERANAAAHALRTLGVEVWLCEAGIVAADALVAMGRFDEGRARYTDCLHETQERLELQASCHTGLGLLMQHQGDAESARAQFELALGCIELQRAALPGDEFRTAYGATKQAPYDGLIALSLDDHSAQGPLRSLLCLERARAPALRHALENPDGAAGLDPERREQLHWLHRQWLQAVTETDLDRAAQVQSRGRQLEREWLEQHRRQQAAADVEPGLAGAPLASFNVETLCAQFPPDTALVVFGLLDKRLIACVATRHGLQRVVAPVNGLTERIEGLRFQIDTLRFGAPALRAHAAQVALRVQAHLQALHAIVWQPVAPLVADMNRVVIVPHRNLHYLPFCALHDGRHSLLERHEISLTPSVALWMGSAGTAPDQRPMRRVAAMGMGGETLPHVAAEVNAVAGAFLAQAGGSADVRLGAAATQPALREALVGADVLHLACHGQFRADSPYFSALHLADGPLTVRDAAALPLQAQLVTLSACETGVSRIAPGDESLGLLRGFLLAGAPRVLATQWTVDDASTAVLMAHFYASVLASQRPAAALRAAQLALLREQPHPYHWAPFALHERG